MPLVITPSIDWDAYHHAIDAIPMEQVISALGVDPSPLDRGRDAHVKCPAHHDSQASLYVYQDENRAYCFGACRRAYYPASLWAKANNMPILDAYDELGRVFNIDPQDTQEYTPVAKPVYTPKEYGYPSPYPDQRIVDFYHRQLKSEDYLWLRKNWLLPDFVVDCYRIGHTAWGDFPAAWVIPICGDTLDTVYTLRYRRDDEHLKSFNLTGWQAEFAKTHKYWGDKKRNAPYLFGEWLLDYDNEWVVITESEKSVLAAARYGLPFVTLTTGVGGQPNAWYDYWHKYIDKYDRWIVMFDDDEPGQLAAVEMVERFGDKVLLFPWPTNSWGGDDTVDFFRLYGMDQVLARIEQVLDNSKHKEGYVIPTLAEKRQSFWRGWQEIHPITWIRR